MEVQQVEQAQAEDGNADGDAQGGRVGGGEEQRAQGDGQDAADCHTAQLAKGQVAAGGKQHKGEEDGDDGVDDDDGVLGGEKEEQHRGHGQPHAEADRAHNGSANGYGGQGNQEFEGGKQGPLRLRAAVAVGTGARMAGGGIKG